MGLRRRQLGSQCSSQLQDASGHTADDSPGGRQLRMTPHQESAVPAQNVRQICVRRPPVKYVAPIMRTRQSSRSASLIGRLQNRHTLHMMRHRNHVRIEEQERTHRSVPTLQSAERAFRGVERHMPCNSAPQAGPLPSSRAHEKAILCGPLGCDTEPPAHIQLRRAPTSTPAHRVPVPQFHVRGVRSAARLVPCGRQRALATTSKLTTVISNARQPRRDVGGMHEPCFRRRCSGCKDMPIAPWSRYSGRTRKRRRCVE